MHCQVEFHTQKSRILLKLFPEFQTPCRGGGGGGGYMHIGYVPHERPPFSALVSPNFPQNPFWSITILHFGRILPFRRPSFSKFVLEHHHFTFLGELCRSGDYHLSVRQRRGLAAGQSASARRVLAVPESSISTLKTALARSGAHHFQAQNGSNSFTLDRELVPQPFAFLFFFSAAHTYQNLGWVGGGGEWERNNH